MTRFRLQAAIRLPQIAGSASVTGDIASSTGGTGDNATRIADALTGYTAPFSYNAPIDPDTNSSATVTPATIGANLVAGRELTLQAGTYGAITLTSTLDNIDIICEAGVVIGDISVSCQSFRLTGNGTTIGNIDINSGATDVMFDNVTHGKVYLGEDGTLRRIAWVNCSLYFTGTNWGVIGGNGSEDIIWVRCDNETTNTSYSTKRVVGITRMIDVACRWKTNAQQNRHHCTETNGTFPMSYIWFEGNQYESGASHTGSQLFVQNVNAPGDGDDVSMSFGWVRSCSFYRNDTDNGHLDVGNNQSAFMSNMTVTGNRAYCGSTPGTAMGFINGSMSSSTASDNLTAAYGSGPPSFPYGAS